MPLAPLPWLSDPLPVGTIQIWAGTIASIPAGWAICDGTGGTPNLLSKFVQGVTTNVTDPGTLGGADTVTLTSSQIAGHNHTITAYSHQHTTPAGTSAGGSGTRITANGSDDDDKTTSNTTPPSQNLIATGSNGPHDNLPPFFQIAYIIKQ